MSRVEALLDAIEQRGDAPALWWRGQSITAADLAARVAARRRSAGTRAGAVVAVSGEWSPESVITLLALAADGAVAVPLTPATGLLDELLLLGHVEHVIEIDRDDRITGRDLPVPAANALLARFRATGHAGLVVFTSGSTGTPKAILHDMERVLAKFDRPRAAYRTLLFLLFDHFGGINTVLSVLASGGVVVATDERTPTAVARVVERARVELLPVTPTFLGLLLASGLAERHDLSSVRLITYGTEVMPEPLLRRLRTAFPNARLQQTYGLSELGVLRSRSRDDDSLWVKVGGEGFETRVVDGLLHVRSAHGMVGYLNAESPFDGDGWMNTGDAVVEQDGWMRILGRTSDLINVGGQKVFPAEVEEVLLSAPNVRDATVRGEPHPLLGAVVVAEVVLDHPEDEDLLRMRLRALCRERLARYKVPVRIVTVAAAAHSGRFKKLR